MSTSTSNDRTQGTCYRPYPHGPPNEIDVLSPRDAQSQEVLSVYRGEHLVSKGIDPKIEGRLFTCLDANVNPAWPITPGVGLKYEELHKDDKEQFCKCNSYQSYQDAVIKYLEHAREHPKTPPPPEILQALCREVPSEGNKKWKCAFKGCEKSPDTLVHTRNHLLGLTHFKNRFFHCSACKRAFCLQHDLNRHMKNAHSSIVDGSNKHSVRAQTGAGCVANDSAGTSSRRYSTRSTVQSQRTTSGSQSGQMRVQRAYKPQLSAYGSTAAINEATAERSPLDPQPSNISDVVPPASRRSPTLGRCHASSMENIPTSLMPGPSLLPNGANDSLFKSRLECPLVYFLSLVYLSAEQVTRTARKSENFFFQSMFLARHAMHFVVLFNSAIDPDKGPISEQRDECIVLSNMIRELHAEMKQWIVEDTSSQSKRDALLARIDKQHQKLLRAHFSFCARGTESSELDRRFSEMKKYDEQSSLALVEGRESKSRRYPPGQAVQSSIDQLRRRIASPRISSIVSSLQATSNILASDEITSNSQGKNKGRITPETQYAVPTDSGQLDPLNQQSPLQANKIGGGTSNASWNNKELINEGLESLNEATQDLDWLQELLGSSDLIISKNDAAEQPLPTKPLVSAVKKLTDSNLATVAPIPWPSSPEAVLGERIEDLENMSEQIIPAGSSSFLPEKMRGPAMMSTSTRQVQPKTRQILTTEFYQGDYRSRSPIKMGTLVLEEQPIATLHENPTEAEVLLAVSHVDPHIFNQLPISPHFRDAVPAIARYKSNRLRQGCTIIDGDDVAAFGIFPHIASFPPSCTPNLHLHWTGNRMQLRAACDIPANTMLSISRDIYCILESRQIRHSRLLNIYGINCQCQVGAGTRHEIDHSDQTRGLISLAVSGRLDPERSSEEQIEAALDQLRQEGLYIYQDTLMYDLYQLYSRADNSAMRLKGHSCLKEAHRLASAIVGDNDSRVIAPKSAIETYPN